MSSLRSASVADPLYVLKPAQIWTRGATDRAILRVWHDSFRCFKAQFRHLKLVPRITTEHRKYHVHQTIYSTCLPAREARASQTYDVVAVHQRAANATGLRRRALKQMENIDHHEYQKVATCLQLHCKLSSSLSEVHRAALSVRLTQPIWP